MQYLVSITHRKKIALLYTSRDTSCPCLYTVLECNCLYLRLFKCYFVLFMLYVLVSSSPNRVSIPQTIANTTQVYRATALRCFARSKPDHHQHAGYSSIYLLVQSLLEYTVWLCNHCYLKTCKNVHIPMEVGLFLRKMYFRCYII